MGTKYAWVRRTHLVTRTCCTADLRALPTWQDPGGDGTVYPCGDDCPFMKQFINEDKNEDIETNHSDGRA